MQANHKERGTGDIQQTVIVTNDILVHEVCEWDTLLESCGKQRRWRGKNGLKSVNSDIEENRVQNWTIMVRER